MKARILLAAVVLGAATAGAAEPVYRVVPGDTLWDLSARRWSDPTLWPELWALNPQIRNPHWIFPGDEIRFARPAARQREAAGRVVRLPVERLVPARAGEPATPDEAGAGPSGAGTREPRGAAPEAKTYRFVRARALDFVSSHPVARLGVVDTRAQRKVAYAPGEDVEIALNPGASVRPGDRLTAFDDREPVVHPRNGEPVGWYVRVLAHLEVESVEAGRAVARILEGYDAVENGAGVMPFRAPVEQVTATGASRGVEGVVLRGQPDRTVLGTDDLVFLDRGRIHGLEPGVVLEFPASEALDDAQGLVDLRSPLARAVVIGVEEKTSAAVLVESRAAVEPGDRFFAASVSP
ncbi:LysM peptidoglycan-binding domain-containing protein [Deferrisoma palaeochoriense]